MTSLTYLLTDHEPHGYLEERENGGGWNGKGRLLGGAMKSCRAKSISLVWSQHEPGHGGGDEPGVFDKCLGASW